MEGCECYNNVPHNHAESSSNDESCSNFSSETKSTNDLDNETESSDSSTNQSRRKSRKSRKEHIVKNKNKKASNAKSNPIPKQFKNCSNTVQHSMANMLLDSIVKKEQCHKYVDKIISIYKTAVGGIKNLFCIITLNKCNKQLENMCDLAKKLKYIK
eukprot:1075991-Ditylum_brightwellii.AAC.1